MKKSIVLLAVAGVSLMAQNYTVPANTRNINVTIKQPISQPVRPVSGVIPNSPILQRPSIIKISGTGEGVPPISTISPAQARALARRAAIADAYRSLAEKMYGIRLSAKDRIKDLVAQSTQVRTSVYGIIRGAKIDSESWKDGLYQVTLVVNLDACRWSSYLSSPSYYKCGR